MIFGLEWQAESACEADFVKARQQPAAAIGGGRNLSDRMPW
jgi:hypothetical protein